MLSLRLDLPSIDLESSDTWLWLIDCRRSSRVLGIHTICWSRRPLEDDRIDQCSRDERFLRRWGIRFSVQRMASQFFWTSWLEERSRVDVMISIARLVSRKPCTFSSNDALRMALETHSSRLSSWWDFSIMVRKRLTRFWSMYLCVRPRTISFDNPSTSSMNENP